MQTATRLWQPRFLLPRFWPTWLMFFSLWLVTRLPFRLQMNTGRLIGWLAWRLAKRRRRIAETNIRLCFPQLDTAAQTALLKAHFLSLGQGIVETALCWWEAKNRYANALCWSATTTCMRHWTKARVSYC